MSNSRNLADLLDSTGGVKSTALDNVAVYTHPTGAGNEHIPTGGTPGQIIVNTASGSGNWQDMPESSGGGSNDSGHTKFSITIKNKVGETIIPWDEHWVGMALCCADQTCAGDTIESWMTSSCCCAGDQGMYDDFFSRASMYGYTLQTTSAEGVEPLVLTFSSGYTYSDNFSVDWGDGTTSIYADMVDNVLSHDYGEVNLGAVYSVSVQNNTNPFSINYNFDLAQYGAVEFGLYGDASFSFSSNILKSWMNNVLAISATDTPDLSNLKSLSGLFQNSDFNQPIGHWDVSGIAVMTYMFQGNTAFNQELNAWNTGSLFDASSMFSGASAFNKSLNYWNVSNLKVVNSMFQGATAFNGGLDLWRLSNLEGASAMFYEATSFGGYLRNVSFAKNASTAYMFYKAIIYSGSFLDTWDVSNVKDMNNMFNGAIGVGQNTNSMMHEWDTSSVTNAFNFRKDATLLVCSSVPVGIRTMSGVNC